MKCTQRKLLFPGLLLAAATLLAACDIPAWLLPPAGSGSAAASPTPSANAIPALDVTATPIDALAASGSPAAQEVVEAAFETAVPVAAVPAAPAAAADDLLCIDPITGASLGIQEALAIAGDSECTSGGELLPARFCDAATGAWWIGLNAPREGCDPACVVNANSRQAQIDWRCSDPVTEAAAPAAGAAQERFDGWRGTILRRLPGSNVAYQLLRDDGRLFSIVSQDSAIGELFAEAAWRASQVSLAGATTIVSGTLNVDSIVQLGSHSAEVRDLTVFAMPSSSSQVDADEKRIYHAWSAVDGVEGSPWCEGVDGPGAGQWLQLDFSAPLEIARLELSNGYNGEGTLFELNNRVRTLGVYLDGEKTAVWELADSRGFQALTLAGDVVPGSVASSLRLVIEDTAPGLEYDDTCISEIAVWGRPAE
jgi:hypothetical protein